MRRDGGQQGKQPVPPPPPLCAKNRRSLCLSALTGAFKGSFIVEVKSGFGRRGISGDATMFRVLGNVLLDRATMDAFIASEVQKILLIFGAN